MSFRIAKEYSFEAAHHLPAHLGKCRRLHGHSYRVEVEVVGPVLKAQGPSEGMLIDFDDLDKVVKPLIAMLDHQNLNAVLPEFALPPTAEMIASFFAIEVTEGLKEQVTIRRVTVWETAKCSASWVDDGFDR